MKRTNSELFDGSFLILDDPEPSFDSSEYFPVFFGFPHLLPFRASWDFIPFEKHEETKSSTKRPAQVQPTLKKSTVKWQDRGILGKLSDLGYEPSLTFEPNTTTSM